MLLQVCKVQNKNLIRIVRLQNIEKDKKKVDT